MKGRIFIIRTNMLDLSHIERRDMDRPPTREEWQAACEGYIQLVPGLSRCRPLIGSPDKCIALCNEDGDRLRLPVNPLATALWHGSAPEFSTQRLVGNVMVLTGDAEFMASL
ncbi:hypothetical protein D2T29_12295 [Sinirhodobacter populi]|uniref:DUF3846 domain-containing protein n=1 Tax=Paenirhodobacter populi TaxID=2306993 RepID=A0A443KCL1_9RHOB|nr:hypothetical protein [Sinirhodobacter populi]RWR30446.1 hypothetical protein D2T29_12295 [Sinirhodobacter populi]